MKYLKTYRLWIALLCVALCVLLGYMHWNRIVGTVYGAEMEKIVIDGVAYVWGETPYHGTDKGWHIGKGAWKDGTRVLDLYRIKGDDAFNYLYARFGWEGQMYVKETFVEQ